MESRKSTLFALLATALLSGCMVQHYHAAPIVPAKTALQLESRSLQDAGLREYMEKTLGHPVSWPMREWNLQTLTLAALYFSPQMQVARDQIAAAQGAIVTAGEHPNPSVSLTPVQVLQAVSTAYQGDDVGKIFQGNQVFDVAVWLAPDERNNVADVASLPIRTPDGNYVTLGQVARVYADSGRYMIYHEGGRRVQPVTCDVTGRSVASFVAQARRRIARLHMPPGVYAEFESTATAAAQARRDLLVHSILAGIGIILLLSIVLANYRNLLLVLLNLPFALVGGIFAAWLFTDRTLSLGSLVGLVTLFGITVRNAIMLISHYEHLVTVDGKKWGPEAALQGALERLSPILMTALVTGLGLLPLALASGRAGAEIEGPMAVVILGGLFTSTLLNLLVLPTLALRFGRFEPRAEI